MNNSIEINYSKSKAYGLYKSVFARYIKTPRRNENECCNLCPILEQ